MPIFVRTLTVVSCLALAHPTLLGAQPGEEQATLSVISAVPPADGVNFSVGAPVVLMRGSFREALRSSGTSLADWTAACKAAELLCPKGLQAAEPLVVSAQMLDEHASASFDGVAPGRYHLFGLGVASSGPVVWDLKVDLQPGSNVLQLDEHNVAPVTTMTASAPSLPTTSRRSDTSAERLGRRCLLWGPGPSAGCPSCCSGDRQGRNTGLPGS